MSSPPTPEATGTEIHLPATALVLLVGISGSGKSTFAARHFLPTQVLSSDGMRAVVADDPNDQAATEAAFELLHTIASLRLARGRLCVVDATNVERWARGRLLALARRNRRPAAAIVLDVPIEVALARNAVRTDRRLPPAAIRRQARWMAGSTDSLEEEGFAPVWTLGSVDAVDRVRVVVEERQSSTAEESATSRT
jgi:predicted kinase